MENGNVKNRNVYKQVLYKGGLLMAITSSSRMLLLLNCGWMVHKCQMVHIL